MSDSKICENPKCGKTFQRPKGLSPSNWKIRKYCNHSCASSANRTIESQLKIRNRREQYVCEGCGKQFEGHKLYQASRKKSGLPALCEVCAKVSMLEKNKAAKGSIEVNGCLLTPSRSGKRCKDHSRCPHYESCMDKIGSLVPIWNGLRF